MPSCFVCARSRTSLTKLQNITFHRFPADHKILEKWYNFLKENGLDVSKITKHSLICSSHFDQNLFIENKSYRTLSKTAVPNIIISRVKSAKAIFPEKKVCLATTSMPILDVKKSLVKVSTSRIDSETSDKELSQLDVAKSCFNENRSIQVSAKNIDCEGVSLLDTSLNTTVEDNVDPSFLATSSTIAVDDTPRRRCLKLGLNKLSRQISSKKKQVKTLQQALRRKEKKIASLKSIILQLKKENLINEDATDILLDSFGCDFNANRLNSIFDNIAVFMDPAHMVKLVRNAFGEKREFIDGDGKQIYFNLVEQLFLIQENEECHLANKLRKSHIFFFKQKMKVKLATQLLSQSVADALKFCKYNLSLQEFSDVDGTVRFIEMFNAAFDIMNSRSINCIGNKKAICKDNFQQVFEFTKLMTDYIRGLKIKDNGLFVPVLESNRKTGFLGFIVCLNSTLHLYSTFIDSDILDHIRMYTISQDHLELFFGSVRAMGGYNNNPSARQFQSAYKKLVVQSHNVGNFSTGNCIPLENIDILHYSSSDPIKTINSSTYNYNKDIISSEKHIEEVDSFINDHDYICNQSLYNFSDFSKEVIIYIAGFVVHKLLSTINCDTCQRALCSKNREPFCNSLIAVKNKGGDKGGLNYPSDEVILICMQTEKLLKSFNYQNQPINTLHLQTKVLHHFYNSNIFISLKSHSLENSSPLADHLTLLIKSISFTYIKLKVNYSLKSKNETPSLRMWYNKMTLFKGQ